MKKTINISLGEHSFIIDEDAFNSLENYLERSKEYTSAIISLEDVIRQKSINPEAAAEAEKLLVQAKKAAATPNP